MEEAAGWLGPLSSLLCCLGEEKHSPCGCRGFLVWILEEPRGHWPMECLHSCPPEGSDLELAHRLLSLTPMLLSILACFRVTEPRVSKAPKPVEQRQGPGHVDSTLFLPSARPARVTQHRANPGELGACRIGVMDSRVSSSHLEPH